MRNRESFSPGRKDKINYKESWVDKQFSFNGLHTSFQPATFSANRYNKKIIFTDVFTYRWEKTRNYLIGTYHMLTQSQCVWGISIDRTKERLDFRDWGNREESNHTTSLSPAVLHLKWWKPCRRRGQKLHLVAVAWARLFRAFHSQMICRISLRSPWSRSGPPCY